ncbi:5681_t:CDS:2 [Acaulospora morrowiae]|uniref:5681_t:CDS:1 n=1 Tax=Acaulospora morrowiae TaxID=94023 RepID=A0A9N9GYE3_9GLOM|nr:5681_t:CDS:2 [Acaulospora morrowiae]
MSNLVSQIENFLLSGPLDAICGASVVYLAMSDNNVDRYEEIRTLADHAVDLAIKKILDDERKVKVLEVLPQLKNGYRSIVGLKAMKVLKKAKKNNHWSLLRKDGTEYEGITIET